MGKLFELAKKHPILTCTTVGAGAIWLVLHSGGEDHNRQPRPVDGRYGYSCGATLVRKAGSVAMEVTTVGRAPNDSTIEYRISTKGHLPKVGSDPHEADGTTSITVPIGGDGAVNYAEVHIAAPGGLSTDCLPTIK